MTTRRKFIQQTFGSAALVSLSANVPSVLMGASVKTARDPGDHILVVLQLSGGNDGLNTVIPYGDDEYYKNRFTLAVEKSRVSKIDDQIGFHPALSGLSGLLDTGQLGIVQGVGYPNPNRSHFESMDLWHTAHRFSESQRLGWLGRCVDHASLKGTLPAIHFGGELQPLALGTRDQPMPSISSLEQFRLNNGGDRFLEKRILQGIRPSRRSDNELLSFIHENASVALQTSQRLENVVDPGGSQREFPSTKLGRKLNAISQLIDSGLPTQVYYVTHEGFDTHSNQGPAHEGLLKEWGDAVQALMQDLTQKGHADRVAVMMFSEFGRRVRENASRGTDHGTAAPLLLAGGKVRSGALGDHPSLTDLDDGDLKYQIDYRQVYATVLEDWLHIKSEPILGATYQKLPLFV